MILVHVVVVKNTKSTIRLNLFELLYAMCSCLGIFNSSHGKIMQIWRGWSVSILTLLAVSSAHALKLPDIGDVVQTIVAPITAPAETTVRILRGDDPAQAVAGPWQAPGRVVQQTSQAFQSAHDIFMRVPRDAIDRNLGSDWREAYDILTASQRIQFEIATTSGRYLGGCLNGQRSCTINQLVAGPLAASLRDAYKVYWSHSAPLPPELIQVLLTVVPSQVVYAARWTLGSTPNFTVPGFLNAGHKAFGGGHAVTIGNVMIFSRMPNLQDADDWRWLLHEMGHIEQYMRYSSDALESIDGFCVDYIQNYNRIEQEAENMATSRQNEMQRQYTFR